MYWIQWSRSAGLFKGDDTHARLLGFDDNLFDLVELAENLKGIEEGNIKVLFSTTLI